MGLINRLFFKGLIVVVPVTLTIYVLVIVSTQAENLFSGFLKKLIGPDLYIPGLGIALTFISILTVGVLVSNFITGKAVKFLVRQFETLPLIKAIYSPLKDLMSLFGSSSSSEMKKVVLVNFENLNMKAIGLVTREEFDDIEGLQLGEDNITVYIPMSYMLGGFTVIVPRKNVEPVEKALKLAITGWIKADKDAL